MKVSIVMYIISIAILGGFGYRIYLIVRALKKYISSSEVRKEKDEAKKSLGEALKEHCAAFKMTQEFVTESLGVSRQAVSKWEAGTSDPSTSNLLALAKLFRVSAETLLNEVNANKAK